MHASKVVALETEPLSLHLISEEQKVIRRVSRDVCQVLTVGGELVRPKVLLFPNVKKIESHVRSR